MSHFFYKYEVYTDSNGIERTLLKWLVNGVFGESMKIDKPTSDITAEDQLILDQFFEEGGIVQDKTDIEIPPDNPGVNM